MAGLFDKFSNAVSGGQRSEALQLALRAESHARTLRGVPSPDNSQYAGDIVPVLKTACLLLEQVLQMREPTNTQVSAAPIAYAPPPPPDPEAVPGYFASPGYDVSPTPLGATPAPGYGTVADPLSAPESGGIYPGEIDESEAGTQLLDPPGALSGYPDDDEIALPVAPPLDLSATAEVKLSQAARQLIKLRDKMCMVLSSDRAPSKEVVESLYRELGKVLEIEGVTTVEDTGAFDHDRHEIVDMAITDDRELDNTISSTVRPGYLFDGRLVRSQEVIVYSFQAREPGASR